MDWSRGVGWLEILLEIYGTTYGGGTGGSGTVFKLNKNRQKTVLYNFTGGTDGGNPELPTLLLDSAGNLYGTASTGGAYGNGVVFKLTP